MNKLFHSQQGAERAMQISLINIFIIVEGKLDKCFFDKVMHRIELNPNVKFQVILISEIEKGGGKKAILTHYAQHRHHNSLISEVYGKPLMYVYCLDKDIDDYCDSKITAENLIYTETYDIEGHLFNSNYFYDALATASLVTFDISKSLIPDIGNWKTQLIIEWKEWLALAMINHKYQISTGCLFGSMPNLNKGKMFGSLNSNNINKLKKESSSALKLEGFNFDLIFNQTCELIESSIKDGNPFKFFKGKWLPRILVHSIKEQLKAKQGDIKGTENAI